MTYYVLHISLSNSNSKTKQKLIKAVKKLRYESLGHLVLKGI